jgi:hypothetical protein
MSYIGVGMGVRWLKWTTVLLAFGFVSFVASMEITDYLEEDNQFCINFASPAICTRTSSKIS